MFGGGSEGSGSGGTMSASLQSALGFPGPPPPDGLPPFMGGQSENGEHRNHLSPLGHHQNRLAGGVESDKFERHLQERLVISWK